MLPFSMYLHQRAYISVFMKVGGTNYYTLLHTNYTSDNGNVFPTSKANCKDFLLTRMIFAEVCLTFCPRSLNYYQLLGTNPPTLIVDLQCVSILKENTWLSWTRVGQHVRLLDKVFPNK